MFSWFKNKREREIAEEPKKEVPSFKEESAKKILKSIKEEFGLDYEKQEKIALKKIERYALKNEIFSFEELTKELDNSHSLKSGLINMLTVGETYFYREMEQIEILCEKILSGKINRILSAPCSSGEEVYSILLYLKSRGQIPPSLHITGIDINSDALASAERGCYSKRSVSQLPQQLLQENFTINENRYCIDSGLRSYTSFTYANIFDRDFEDIGRFDAVLSRNMMIYFSDREKRRALKQLSSVMHEGSTLFLGHADISFTPEGFEKVRNGRTTYFKKL